MIVPNQLPLHIISSPIYAGTYFHLIEILSTVTISCDHPYCNTESSIRCQCHEPAERTVTTIARRSSPTPIHLLPLCSPIIDCARDPNSQHARRTLENCHGVFYSNNGQVKRTIKIITEQKVMYVRRAVLLCQIMPGCCVGHRTKLTVYSTDPAPTAVLLVSH